MWNDTDIPLAYLITIRTYGTWLHGDERGSTNRFRNGYGTPFLPHNNAWLTKNQGRLAGKPILLETSHRTCVEKAIRETCKIRRWDLYAVNVRTNHAHSVVAIGAKKPGAALNAFKANATREMRTAGLISSERSPWADKGSNRSLWNERSIVQAIDYVLYGQGDELPDFD
jgi:REP element-mobilizing transposase RayT